MMPKIETLYLCSVGFFKGFLQPNPDGPYANTELLPSLRLLCLANVSPDDDDWSHLTTYLAHQTSEGQIILLELTGYHSRVPRGVMDKIKDLVEEFTYHRSLEME